jgi:hypothetical protein
MISLLSLALAGPVNDLVGIVPGFAKATFPVYSGYLHVPGPIESTGTDGPYDSIDVHYQLNCQLDTTTVACSPDHPIVAWHQGGPGGSSTQGGMIEMSWFQVDGNGTHTNPHSWNKYANMLYLEAPAGSGGDSGFSTCTRGGAIVGCSWDDVTQAAAYTHTLVAFKAAFPELATAKLFLAGESYFGQYGPNIANYIISHEPFNTTLNLEGLLVGNGCWGGDATSVNCNGPNSERNDIDTLFGKNLISKSLYTKTNIACGWTDSSPPADSSQPNMCATYQHEASKAAGPHNVYDVYDNCPRTAAYLAKMGNKTMRWLLKKLRSEFNDGVSSSAGDHHLLGGGYEWSCGDTYPPGAVAPWFLRKDVQAALHLDAPGRSKFDYKTSGPASVTLYPELVKKVRVLIYNGDADTCVPFKGNEEWIDGLAAKNVISEYEAWRPWLLDDLKSMPQGYVTTYDVEGTSFPTRELIFVTIRCVGLCVCVCQTVCVCVCVLTLSLLFLIGLRDTWCQCSNQLQRRRCSASLSRASRFREREGISCGRRGSSVAYNVMYLLLFGSRHKIALDSLLATRAFNSAFFSHTIW